MAPGKNEKRTNPRRQERSRKRAFHALLDHITYLYRRNQREQALNQKYRDILSRLDRLYRSYRHETLHSNAEIKSLFCFKIIDEIGRLTDRDSSGEVEKVVNTAEQYYMDGVKSITKLDDKLGDLNRKIRKLFDLTEGELWDRRSSGGDNGDEEESEEAEAEAEDDDDDGDEEEEEEEDDGDHVDYHDHGHDNDDSTDWERIEGWVAALLPEPYGHEDC
jgi:hypothetical protein